MSKKQPQQNNPLAEDICNTMADAKVQFQSGKISREEYIKWVSFCRSAAYGQTGKMPEEIQPKKSKE